MGSYVLIFDSLRSECCSGLQSKSGGAAPKNKKTESTMAVRNEKRRRRGFYLHPQVYCRPSFVLQKNFSRLALDNGRRADGDFHVCLCEGVMRRQEKADQKGGQEAEGRQTAERLSLSLNNSIGLDLCLFRHDLYGRSNRHAVMIHNIML